MSDWVDRLRRRKLLPWVAASAAGAWVAFEVAGALSDTWMWPPFFLMASARWDQAASSVRNLGEASNATPRLLDTLASTLQHPAGPERETVYGPLVPAVLGPEVMASERARSLMRLTYENRR